MDFLAITRYIFTSRIKIRLCFSILGEHLPVQRCHLASKMLEPLSSGPFHMLFMICGSEETYYFNFSNLLAKVSNKDYQERDSFILKEH